MILTKSILLPILLQCGMGVSPETLQSVIDVESGGNPYALAVVYKKNTPDSKIVTQQNENGSYNWFHSHSTFN